MIRKILLVLLILFMLLVSAAGIYVASRQHLTFDAPVPDISASSDTAVVARGRYLVRNALGCPECHGDPTQRAAWMAGADVPLSGGFSWHIPPGTFFARNITPDAETGIGKFSDGAVARALRFGVGHDGRALLPFMETHDLSDDDLLAVVSYLRVQPPVHHVIPAHKPNLLGKVVIATVLANPVGPTGTPPKVAPHGATVENGRYLAESVANCWACHTQRNESNGQLVGPRFGGATGFQSDDRTRTWSPPNITSDPQTGRLATITEDQFVARFRAGRIIPGSPMPWQGLARLDEDDLRAIYRYLKSVPPVKRDVGPPFVEVKKK